MPKSFDNMFQYLPLSDQVYRDHDYNFKPKTCNKNFLCHFPTVQLLRAWNRSHLLVKSEAEINLMKATFISQKLSTYEEECVKQFCYICKRT